MTAAADADLAAGCGFDCPSCPQAPVSERDLLVRRIAVAMSDPTLSPCPALGHYERQAERVADALADVTDELVREAKADGWDERSKARPQYLGPLDGHYDDCAGWEDCWCASYPNPYRPEPAEPPAGP